jgi:hypothetical protein
MQTSPSSSKFKVLIGEAYIDGIMDGEALEGSEY